MPRQDKTGPTGRGPMSGRGFGPCGRGFASDLRPDRGYGSAMHGWLNEKYQAISKEEKKDLLKLEIEELKEEMRMVEEELKELEK